MTPKPLTYERFSDDVFMLLCRAETPVAQMAEHPVIAELVDQMDETREIVPLRTGCPHGAITKACAWRGYFTVGGARLQVKALYAFPKFFGIICDTESGEHDTEAVLEFVEGVNAAVAAALGVESLG